MIAARHYRTLSFVIVDNLGLYVKRIGRLIYEWPAMQETRPDSIVDASRPRVNHSNRDGSQDSTDGTDGTDMLRYFLAYDTAIYCLLPSF